MGECAPRFTEPKLDWTAERYVSMVSVLFRLNELEHWQAVAAKVFYDLREADPYTVIYPET